MRKLFLLILLLCLVGICGMVSADSLWNVNHSISLITDHKANRVGDLLTIVIVQSSTTRHEVQSDTSKTIDESVRAGTGILDFISPYFLSGDRSSSGAASSQQNMDLVDRLTVKVVNVLPNGVLCIEGERVVQLIPDKLTLTLTGLVRPEDISPDNTIVSSRIADLVIVTNGKGPAVDTQKPGIISRLLRLLW